MNSVTPEIESKLITGEELLEMGDLGPCELVEGRIKPMSPTGAEHGLIELNLAYAIKNFIKRKKIGWVLTGEVGIFTKRDPDTVRGADIVFISKNRLPNRPQRKYLDTAPELAIEIISPKDNRKDVQNKIEEYFQIGVKWVWIVEPNKRTLTVYGSVTEAERLTEKDTLIGQDILTGFRLKISKIFEE